MHACIMQLLEALAHITLLPYRMQATHLCKANGNGQHYAKEE